MPQTSAMILAAGRGTRLRPLTDTKPKALIEVNGVPLIERLILRLETAQIQNIVVNVHHFALQIIDFLNQSKFSHLNISISDETSQLLDTGGGIAHASTLFGQSDPVLVHNVDVISDIDINKLIATHQSQNALATLAVRNRQSSRKLFFDNNNRLAGWKNLKTNQTKQARPLGESPKELAFSGIQVLSKKIFPLITETGAFSIIDTYLRLAKSHKIIAFEHNNSFWMDMGKISDFQQLEKKAKQLDNFET